VYVLYTLNYNVYTNTHYNLFYVGATRTPNSKYQKFMTYRLVDNIK
jgi:hypothetical protein